MSGINADTQVDVGGTPTVASWGSQREAMQEDLEMVDDVWGGTRSMREAATRRLPQEPAESTEHYQNRLRRSVFFNGYKRTVKNLVGKPFSKPIKVAPTLDKRVVDLMQDIDRTGRHFDVFAVNVMEQGIKDGMVGLLIDYPDTSAITNAADEVKAKPRPYVTVIDVRRIIACRFKVTNGQHQILQLRLWEQVIEQDGDWGEKTVDQVRVLEPGTWTTYRRAGDEGAKKQEWIEYQTGVSSIKDTVPFVVYYTNRQDYMVAEPPLIDLAHLNIEHWQSSSDQRNILHVVRVPILFAKGWADFDAKGGKNDVVISASTVVTNSAPDSDLKYVEHQGHGIDAGRADLEAIENKMAVMGTQVLVKHAPQPGLGQKTATQTVADDEADYCDLAVMTRLLEDALEGVLGFFAKFINVPTPDDRYVTINKDFGISQRDAQDANLLLQMRMSGEVTQETFLNELQRRGILDPALDVGDEIQRIKLEPPRMLPGLPDPQTEANQSGSESIGGKGTGPGPVVQ